MKVFREGPPGDAMWVQHEDTWAKLRAGRLNPEGLFVRAEDALRFAWACVEHVTAPVVDWCGSESGQLSADDIADRKADKQHDFDR